MKNGDKQDVLDKNLTQMFSMSHDAVSPDFEERLVLAVGQEVQRQRRTRSQRHWFIGLSAAAAILIVTVLVFQSGSPIDDGPIGTIAKVQGLVLLTNGHAPEIVKGPRDIHARQWLQTRSGTTAQLVLTDRSQLTSQPRTVMQLDRQRQGHIVRIEEGAVAIAAHKQPPKQYMTVETPGTAIKVLGTELDVRVIENPTGVRQTRVHLHSGVIDVVSGGVSTRLLPGMVGLTEEGKSPVVQSSVLEVNELRRMWKETQQRAEQNDAQANMPMIIDYVGSTVWAMVPLSRFKSESEYVFSLQLKYPAFGVKAYTQEGALAKTSAVGRTVHVDLSQRPQGAETVTHVVLRVPRATGLFHFDNGDVELEIAGGTSHQMTWLQLCLPKSATVEAVSGRIIETTERLDRLVITLEADSHSLRVYE